MKVNGSVYTFKILLLVLFVTSTSNVFSQEKKYSFENGRELFRTNCSPCHDVHKEVAGPMLASITKKRPVEWLIPFIKNSQEVIASGDEYANFLYDQYNHYVMPSFMQLSDKEIKDILHYIERESPRRPAEVDADSVVILKETANSILEGKQIFQRQCEECHHILYEHDYGPALGSVTKRRPKEWLIRFIRNSQEVIHSGDPYAIYLFSSFDGRIMVPMEFLTEEEITEILEYIDYASSSSHAMAGVNGRNKLVSSDYVSLHVNVPGGSSRSAPFFKILFIIISVAGAVVHTYLIIKLFLYLRQEKKEQ